jgi:hypothetical protein
MINPTEQDRKNATEWLKKVSGTRTDPWGQYPDIILAMLSEPRLSEMIPHETIRDEMHRIARKEIDLLVRTLGERNSQVFGDFTASLRVKRDYIDKNHTPPKPPAHVSSNHERGPMLPPRLRWTNRNVTISYLGHMAVKAEKQILQYWHNDEWHDVPTES